MKKNSKMRRTLAILLLLCLFITYATAENISPTTGLPIPGEATTPVVTVISYGLGKGKVGRKTIEAPGLGKQQNWGGVQADIVFESLLFEKGNSRLVFLYHDALVRREAIYAGPIRSLRALHVTIADVWNAGLVCRAASPYAASALEKCNGNLFEHWNRALDSVLMQVNKKKMPDNISADVTAIYAMMENAPPTHAMWLFADWTNTAKIQNVNEDEIVVPESLTWGGIGHTTSFTYDPATNQYNWFANGAPMKSWRDYTCTEEAAFLFENVVILYAEHSFPTPLLPEIAMKEGWSGAAIVYNNGAVQNGRWLMQDGQLLLLNEKGENMMLTPGKTYVAIQPI